MSNRIWLNLSLLILLGALGVVAWLRPGPSPEAPHKLTDLNLQDIAEISVVRTGADTISLVRRADGWWLEQPLQARANLVRVGSLFDLAQKISENRYSLTDLDPGEYGLSADSTRIHLNERELILGAPNVVTGQRYIQSGDTLHLVHNDLIDFDTASPASYVALRLLPADADITQIELPDLSLTQNADGDWNVQPSIGDDNVQTLLETWRNASARWTDEGGPDDEGEPITIAQAGAVTTRFEIVARAPELVLLNTDIGVKYYLPAKQAVALFPAAPQ